MLDRENAHFILSEAMISTFEQMNFERCLQQREEAQGGKYNVDKTDPSERELLDDKYYESDEEIKDLKMKLSQRRSELDARKKAAVESVGLLSDGQTDDTTATTDQSASPGYSDTEGPDLTDRNLDSNDEDFMESEMRRSTDTLTGLPDSSAESIALSLLSRVGQGRLPPADSPPPANSPPPADSPARTPAPAQWSWRVLRPMGRLCVSLVASFRHRRLPRRR